MRASGESLDTIRGVPDDAGPFWVTSSGAGMDEEKSTTRYDETVASAYGSFFLRL